MAVAVGARKPHAGHARLIADNFLELVVPHQFDLAFRGFFEQPILHDLLCTQRIAPMHQCDVLGDVREVQRFFDRGIAAADDRHVLAAIEESVARRARRHTLALERFFGRKAEILRGCARCDDQRIARKCAGVANEFEWARAEPHRVNVIVNGLHVKAFDVLLHTLHQHGALQAFDVARPVVDVGRRRQLATDLDAGDQQRRKIGARGVERRGIAGRTGTQNDEPMVRGVTHSSPPRRVSRPRPA